MKRSGPLRRKTFLRSKRPTPRRKDPSRVQHERVKRKPGDAPTKLEAIHLSRVAQMGCLVSGKPATVHHVTGYADRAGRFARSHRLVVPLAPEYHQKVADPKAADPISVEGLGHRGFFRKHGIDLRAVAERLWKETCNANVVEARRPENR